MTITVEDKTIELSADFASRVRAMAEAEGVAPVDVIFHIAANVLAPEEGRDLDDPEAGAEIAAAAADFEAGYARGERGFTVSETMASLDALFIKRAYERQQREAA